ncbi:hypothetical protein IFU08_09310 [Microbacterium sp. CFBP 8790]|uniref:hypothetical protein n=1 Tax=unclassified Microbacterium TaxID=2609290 RepID=UPI00178085B0|nr:MULTISPECIES: hypothetical protein [unclassified Microbacterium]MBD8205180.1 hypothetical protein [Microbacterium sp. CFBP 8801]MBD8509765.1 hypothetical protein [Microbacterium sp. CFBP 8790]
MNPNEDESHETSYAPIPDQLEGVVAKILRAGALLAEIDQLALQFMMGNSPTFDVVPNLTHRSYTVTAHVPSPPLSIAVMFGEVLHNLRSCLDHVARLLVLAAGGTPVDKPPRATSFPILLDAPSRSLGVFPGIRPEALEAIESLQPYRSAEGERHPLWRLSILNNIDKHRLLHVTSLSGAGGVAFVPAPLDPEASTTQEQRRHTVRLLPEQPQVFLATAAEMHDPAAMAGLWSYTVVLGEPGAGFRDQVVGVGHELLDFVADQVLPTLASFTLPPQR